MEESYEVLKDVINQVGVKSVATQMGLSQPLLYKWCNDSKEGEGSYKAPTGAFNPLDRVRKLYEITNDSRIINWVCHIADGYFVENPSMDKTYIYSKVSKTTQKLIKEFSETLEVISQSYDNDKKIDSKEAKNIRKEWEDLKSVGESFVKACELGKFG